MLHNDKRYGLETDILSAGHFPKWPVETPEILPVYMTNQFQPEDLQDLQERNKNRNFGYNRNRNPNRTALAEAMTMRFGRAAQRAKDVYIFKVRAAPLPAARQIQPVLNKIIAINSRSSGAA